MLGVGCCVEVGCGIDADCCVCVGVGNGIYVDVVVGVGADMNGVVGPGAGVCGGVMLLLVFSYVSCVSVDVVVYVVGVWCVAIVLVRLHLLSVLVFTLMSALLWFAVLLSLLGMMLIAVLLLLSSSSFVVCVVVLHHYRYQHQHNHPCQFKLRHI